MRLSFIVSLVNYTQTNPIQDGLVANNPPEDLLVFQSDLVERMGNLDSIDLDLSHTHRASDFSPVNGVSSTTYAKNGFESQG